MRHSTAGQATTVPDMRDANIAVVACRPTLSTAALVFALLVALKASAVPMVFFSVQTLDDDLFQYDLAIDNSSGTTPLSGLLVLEGGSLFGLDAASEIGAPPQWSFLPPSPPFVDILSYFSLSVSADIPVGGSLAGFSFQSMTDPGPLKAGGFAVVGIDAMSASQIAIPNAQFVPEPSTLLLAVAAGFAAWGSGRRATASSGARGRHEIGDDSSRPPYWTTSLGVQSSG